MSSVEHINQNMLNTALRLAAATRTQPPPLYVNPLRGRRHVIRLRRIVTKPVAAASPDDMQKAVNDTEKPAQPKAAKQQNQQPKTGDTMSSFGEGYATRSDEEGFGGIYGGNTEEKEEKIIHGNNAPEYDDNQGSEVKEKEKGRNQPHPHHHSATSN